DLTPKQFTPDSLAANFNKFSPEISEKQIGAKKLQPQLSTPSQSSPQIQRNPIAQLESLGQLKDILTRVLGNASGVIGSIIKNPVGFATNLVSALRQGFGQFVTNIRTHLQNGLVNWLTGGSLGSIRQPISLSNPQGIFNLTLQILGVGGNYIRSRAVNKFGATFVSRLEKSVSLFQQLKNNGLLGMFSQIQQQLGNLQTTVVEGIRKFLIERVIQAGVKWILGLLVLPISGVVKAAQTVYQVLDFFINQAARVAALVQAVTTAVQTVASGKTGVAAKAVEEALARAIPVLMGFMATLAGVGGNLAPKIRSLLAKVKAKIDAVIDGLLERAKGLLLRQGNGQVRGNGGQTSSRTTGQSPPTNRQNSQQNKPNSVLRNNQISAPNNRQNPQQKMPNPAGQNNQRPATNNRQNQQQQQTKLDHDRKVRVGLNQINQEEKKYLDNGKIYREDARKIAAKVKQAHPIFKAITVIDGGKSWNYKWVASEGIDEGPEKAEPIAEQNLRTAKQHFQDREFTAEELATVIRENPRTAVRRIKIWRENDRIFQVSNNLYTFAAIGTSLERAKERFQQNQFTTAQLAEALRLEIRTAQRSVKEWLDRQENTGLYRVPATKDKYAFDPKLAPSQTQQQGGHQSTYVDPQTWEILLQYRDKIRDRFYKKNYRQDRLAEVLKRAYAGKDPQGNELYRCSYTNSPQLQGPKHKDLSVYQVPGVTGGEIDHITDVTQHWELHGGKNMTQAQRGEWYDNSDNLQFLCASCNRAKPKGIFTFKVGRDFRGPNEK
ncbi:GH-E family nuclease, partial [Microcoleus sp. AT3-A2]|uniref:GH-E family nuclease n=1 Tax=Microcoleus sp. AT3-A2 TaxID=2818610 RepID=UPI002FD5A520